MTKLNKVILAGLFAASNYGLGVDTGKLLSALQRPPKGIGDAVHHFCDVYCENESDLDMFNEEGGMWYSQLSDMDDDTIRTLHFEKIALYDEIAAMVKGD